MPGGPTLYLLIFAVTNLAFFVILTTSLVVTSRQQRRIKELSQHLTELVDDLHAANLSLADDDADEAEGGGEAEEADDSGAGQA